MVGDSTSVMFSVVDTAGNTYTRAVGPTTYTVDLSQSIYYAAGIKAAATNKITVTFNVNAASRPICAPPSTAALSTHDSPLDVTATASGQIHRRQQRRRDHEEPVRAALRRGHDDRHLHRRGLGLHHVLIVTTNGNLMEDEIVSTTGSYAATGTQSRLRRKWVMQLAAFQ